jgi:hypothetical protein
LESGYISRENRDFDPLYRNVGEPKQVSLIGNDSKIGFCPEN